MSKEEGLDMTRLLSLIFSALVMVIAMHGQGVVVNDQGVMVWEKTGEEVQGFGVNYTVPFAHAYRSAKKLGVDPLEAIDHDVYHFARLGFDLYRVHVWDTEISDTLGNLLYNEHFHAFDYLLYQLAERNINYVLTPIAFWGNGWPEPDEETPGFSHKYGKDKCLTDPDAIKAQENYLYQFLNHVNPYTGIAYKDDPRLIAVEISNEPHHREDPEKVTAFIKLMVEAVRKTNFQRPIFYNISHSVHLVEEYFAAGIDGGTFQWYPTGLGYQKELQGNFLPNVDHYDIHFDEAIKKYGGAKLVYEFDSPDIGKPYMYPAMARSFRAAGIQIATHFAYDPTYLAHANTEYNTHHMNLAYTPAKALALKICSEIFHDIPMYKNYGKYPDNTSFGDFMVSYEKDLALLNNGEKYFYTNDTDILPVNQPSIKEIAGHGSSPIVSYEGTGAYFVDQLEHGVWRLEVLPDAAIVSNPYGRNSLDKKVAVVQWNERKMSIQLEDIGKDFTIQSLHDRSENQPMVEEGNFIIKPGVYLLLAKDKIHAYSAASTWKNIRLGEYFAPPSNVEQTYLTHQPPPQALAGNPLTIHAQVISDQKIEKVEVIVNGGWRSKTIAMQEREPFQYMSTLDAELVSGGFLNYYLLVTYNDGTTMTYPAKKPGHPWDWDFYDRQTYQVRVIGPNQPVSLFDAQRDWTSLSVKHWTPSIRLLPLDDQHSSVYEVKVETLYREDPENLNGEKIYDYTIRHYLPPILKGMKGDLSDKKSLIVKIRSLEKKSVPVQIALTTNKGKAYGKVIQVDPFLQEYEIPIADLEEVPLVTMPRPYPTFLPYFFEGGGDDPLELRDIEGLQISLGPRIFEDLRNKPHGIGIVEVYLD